MLQIPKRFVNVTINMKEREEAQGKRLEKGTCDLDGLFIIKPGNLFLRSHKRLLKKRGNVKQCSKSS
jgi:hypothetical protein